MFVQRFAPALVLVLGTFGTLRAADPPRAEQLATIATIASDAYFDQKNVVLAPAPGNRVLVRGGFPPAQEPNRSQLVQKALPKVTDRTLVSFAETAAQIQWQYEFDCWVVDKAITAQRMDAKFLKEQAEEWKKGVAKGLAEGMLAPALGKSDPSSAFETALYQGFAKQFAATYAVGLAQTLRSDFGNQRQGKFQKLWDEKLLPELLKTKREKLGGSVEVGRTQVIEQAGGQQFVIWSGLAVRNSSKDDLSNVCVDLGLSGPGNQKIRRTYFFPQLKAGQVMMLVVDDRGWNGQTGALSADKLQAEVRVLCDQGEQASQTMALLRPAGKALDFTAGKPIAAEDLNAAADGEAKFRELAKKNQSVVVNGMTGGKKVEITLDFSEPTEPLKSLGGVPIVDTKKFVLVKATFLNGKVQTNATLDGYFDGATLMLYSHGNLNVIDAPNVAKGADKLHGTVTLSGGKFTVQFPNQTGNSKYVSKE